MSLEVTLRAAGGVSACLGAGPCPTLRARQGSASADPPSAAAPATGYNGNLPRYPALSASGHAGLSQGGRRHASRGHRAPGQTPAVTTNST